MSKKLGLWILAAVVIGIIGLFLYPKIFSSKPERTILYWTDPMIPGDRSDRPGKSPMGMERVPVYEDQQQHETTAASQPEQETYYTCPMHPSVHKDKPGACPVCGMALVKKTIRSVDTSNRQPDDMKELPRELAVNLSPAQRVMANITVAKVQRRTVNKDVRAVGVVSYAEPNYRHISMRFPGRLDRLYLSYTGQAVRKGDPVADVYSPEAISAQQEYLLANGKQVPAR